MRDTAAAAAAAEEVVLTSAVAEVVAISVAEEEGVLTSAAEVVATSVAEAAISGVGIFLDGPFGQAPTLAGEVLGATARAVRA